MMTVVTLAQARGVTVAAINLDVLDMTTVAGFKDEFGGLPEDTPALVLDLGGLEFMDSSGVGALLWAYRKITEQGGRMVLARLNPAVRLVVETLHMDRFFAIHGDTDQAIEALAEKGA